MDFLGTQISNAIWDAMLKWFYEIIYGAIADFFEMMGNMGADVFDLEWVKATVKLFTLFGWGLFVAGTVVAIFDVAIEYQCGRANVKTTALNIIKGFFACSLIGVVPIELYKFCISLQNTFSHDLARIFAGTQSLDLAGQSTSVLQGSFMVAAMYISAGVGAVIAENASIAGASGGCQAEIGSASAMAAAGLCFLQGGTNAMIANAAALALKNMLGLACDPVCGLVEVPCVKRNVAGAVNAVSAAQLSLAGIKSAIPVDEVIDAMRRIGNEMSPNIKETGQGGLATTPTAIQIGKSL